MRKGRRERSEIGKEGRIKVRAIRYQKSETEEEMEERRTREGRI